MSIYKRGGVWWVRFTAPSGERIRQSARSGERRQAEEFEAQLRARLWRQHQLGERRRFSWQEAVERWAREASAKRTLHDDIAHLRWLDPYLCGLFLDDVDRDVLDRIVDGRLAEGASPATANRTIAVVRAILRRAWKEWGWIDSVPPFRVLKEPKRRIRWLTHERAAVLLRELPAHLAEMARFALATGLREANVAGLAWADVDLPRGVLWVHADEAKSNRTFGVPLNEDALAVLRRQRGKHAVQVFTYTRDGVARPVARCQGLAWRKALDRAGIAALYRGPLDYPHFCGRDYLYPDFRWHDLRHTWATWHVQGGTPLEVLQELGGWSDIRMVQRYAHFSPGHLAGYANAIRVPGARLA